MEVFSDQLETLVNVNVGNFINITPSVLFYMTFWNNVFVLIYLTFSETNVNYRNKKQYLPNIYYITHVFYVTSQLKNGKKDIGLSLIFV